MLQHSGVLRQTAGPVQTRLLGGQAVKWKHRQQLSQASAGSSKESSHGHCLLLKVAVRGSSAAGKSGGKVEAPPAAKPGQCRQQ
jgi:hypothetical protein